MITIDRSEFQQKYYEAYAMRAWGEQDGEPHLLWLAGALFFDLQMYAASARCRDRARHYTEVINEPMPDRRPVEA